MLLYLLLSGALLKSSFTAGEKVERGLNVFCIYNPLRFGSHSKQNVNLNQSKYPCRAKLLPLQQFQRTRENKNWVAGELAFKQSKKLHLIAFHEL